MGAARALELRAVTVDGLVEVVPYVDGRSLVDVVGRFESARGYSPAGAYGGLVPAFFRYGDAAHQWYGRGRVPAGGRAWVLACDCHEAGCWPFEVAFDRAQYDDAVRAVAHLFG